MSAEWWLCPNEPRCPHGAVLHDIDDDEDTSPRCSADGCDCGRVLPDETDCDCDDPRHQHNIKADGYPSVSEEP